MIVVSGSFSESKAWSFQGQNILTSDMPKSRYFLLIILMSVENWFVSGEVIFLLSWKFSYFLLKTDSQWLLFDKETGDSFENDPFDPKLHLFFALIWNQLALDLAYPLIAHDLQEVCISSTFFFQSSQETTRDELKHLSTK
jgi:hypothetical protein